MASRLLAPRYVLLAAVAACALAVGGAFIERRAAGVDADALVAAAIAVSGAPPERAAAAESVMRPMMANYPVLILLGMGVTWLVSSTVAFGMFAAVQAGLTFGTVFAATIYASLAHAAARLVLLGVLSLARQPTADEIVQGTFVSANIGAIMPPESAGWLLAMGRSLDALTMLMLYVFVGVLAESGRSKVGEKTLLGVVAAAYLVWIAVRVGWAAMFGR